MTRGLLVITSATLVALGIPISGMAPVGTSASNASRTVENELVRMNQVGIRAEAAVRQKKENTALSDGLQMVRDMRQVRSLWPHQPSSVTIGMLQNLTVTMNTVLGLEREIQAVGWPGTRSLERSLRATWNMGAQLLSLANDKSLGTTSSFTVLPPPTVTTVTTMPSSAVAGPVLPAVTSSTSVAAANHRGDRKHGSHQGPKAQGDGHTQPGHHPKHHQGDKHHGH